MIALVGLPGAGKSTVGRLLSKRLGMPFADSDHEIEARLGVPIREFFAIEGEDRFRDIETEELDRLTQSFDGVLSTGGGIVLRPRNRDMLRQRAQVVYLRATPEELYKRLRNDQVRPLLQVVDPLQKLKELHDMRDSWYREVAHVVVETGLPSKMALVNSIMQALGLRAVTEVASSSPPSSP